MEINNLTKKIIFTGGGTGGSVTPLLAIAEELLRDGPDNHQATIFNSSQEDRSFRFNWEFLFVGTYQGPEREMVTDFNSEVGPMRFVPLVSGKLRRYFSPANFFDAFKVFASWFVSLRLLSVEKPDLIVSAGSFVSVPLVWAAALRRIPIIIHQQDARPGLANRLMAPFARLITVTFEKSLADFGPGSIFTGNPVRSLAINEEELQHIKKKFNIDPDRPFILITGGGTGAASINRLVARSIKQLTQSYQIIHVTGKGKLPHKIEDFRHYQAYEFIANKDILGLMMASDLIVSRCGLAFLTELSALNKAALLIPMPESHQEDNADIFRDAGAAIVLRQDSLSPLKFTSEIDRAISDVSLRADMCVKVGLVIKRGAATKIAVKIKEIISGV